MKLSRQDVADILTAIADAQAELCVGPNFPEATAINERWESLKQRFSEKLKKEFEADRPR